MDNNTPHLLLVDDDLNLLETLGEIFKVKGFEVICSQTGEAALAYVERQPMDVALIDLKLGDMSGLDVLRGIKAFSPESECILLTGNASQASAIQAIQMGAFGYIQKPFEVEQVVLSAQRAADKYRSTLALRESEEKYRRLFDRASLGIFQSSPQGKAISVNPAFARMFGYDSIEDALQSIKDVSTDIFVDPNRRAEIIHIMKENPQLRIFENVYRRKDGSSFIGNLNTMPIMDSEGRLIRIEGIIEDITQRKQMEDTLRESEERFRLAFEHAHVGMTLVDLQGRFMKMNPQICLMFGYSQGELEGKSINEITHPDYQNLSFSFMQQAIEGRMDHSEFEKLYIHKNGSFVWGLVSSSLVRNAAGVPLYFIAHIQDITARKQTENELLNLKESLEEANRELQTALAREQTLSHTDVLTGIHNRRHLFELAGQKLAVALRYQQPLAVMMMDIDHFKKVNDTFGHAVGDQMLKSVTQIACAKLRSADVIGRYGGEEFVILLPMTNAQQAILSAERIRAGVAALRVPTEKGDASATLSIGIVEINHELSMEAVEDVFRRADQAMYAAKQAGRNRVVIFSSPE
ncbi:MAG: PAS domain S-box protein [Anaerolineales bacterium]|nr:PAS domain S-box protein [Anaerolineales bacterium]